MIDAYYNDSDFNPLRGLAASIRRLYARWRRRQQQEQEQEQGDYTHQDPSPPPRGAYNRNGNTLPRSYRLVRTPGAYRTIEEYQAPDLYNASNICPYCDATS